MSIVSLAKKSDLAVHASVVETLKELLEDIESGRIQPTKPLALYVEVKPDGGWSCGRRNAGCNFPEHLALLEVDEADTLDEWGR